MSYHIGIIQTNVCYIGKYYILDIINVISYYNYLENYWHVTLQTLHTHNPHSKVKAKIIKKQIFQNWKQCTWIWNN